MFPPIMGQERECPILVYCDGKQLPDFFDSRENKELLLEALRGFPVNFKCQCNHYVHVFLLNGAKAYFDTPSCGYFEYATPEASSARSLVLYAKAAEKNVALAVCKLNKMFATSGVVLKSFMNNNDIMCNSRGTHENYSKLKNMIDLPPGDILRGLGPHLISRIFYTGNGWLSIETKDGWFSADNDRFCFYLSQRALVTETETSGSSVSQRPIIDTKDEQNSEPCLVRRQHITVGDALMAEIALFLQYGTTYIVLDMLEEGWLQSHPFQTAQTGDFVKALKTFNRDTSLRVKFPFSGGDYSAIEIQEYYLKNARRFFRKHRKPTEEVRQILKLWKQMIELAKKPKPYEHLAPFVDWAMKRKLIEQKLEKYGRRFEDPIGAVQRQDGTITPPQEYYVLKALDLGFAENHPDGYYNRLARQGSMKRLVEDREVEPLLDWPLNENRAIVRATQLKKTHDRIKPEEIVTFCVDWGTIRITLKDGTVIESSLIDPRNSAIKKLF